ncbi:MAG: hypothetical protein KDB22_22120 [Planctomycetales bacterium]|nr:hypothetical protein [Planctomycetales bacterium]
MSDQLSFTKVCGGDEPLLDVLFVHGLTGDPKETWACEKTGEYWLKWLCVELPGIAVYSLGYPASLFEKWAKKEMELFERAANALEYMTAKGIGQRPLAFVAHSLGGLLVKQIIRKSCDSEDHHWKSVCEATRLVAFLATPHTGASLASALKMAIPRFASKHIDLLSNDSGILTDINEHYRSFANNKKDIATVAYYEKYKTSATVLVVSKSSADPGVAGTQPVPMDKDHISICKPRDKEDLVYVGIKMHLQRALDSCRASSPTGNGGSFAADNYSARTEEDRRDLLQKLIAAGREHEYSKANNLQNKFAQNYLKLGLYTTARGENERLLAEVEQRFVTHIYHPLICKKRSDEEIRNALQTHVIDALCEKHANGKGFTQTTVLSALYFLTEQCHIRWDAAS